MIMKKITALILLCLAVLGLQAQTINRMIVQPKTGYPQGYAIDGVDSVFFDSVSDDVAAAITVNKVSTFISRRHAVGGHHAYGRLRQVWHHLRAHSARQCTVIGCYSSCIYG